MTELSFEMEIFRCTFIVVLSISHLTTAEVRGRRRTSEHSDALEVMVRALSQKVDQLTAQNNVRDTQLTELKNRLGKYPHNA